VERWENFRFECAGGVATVTLDRPGKLNALTFGAYADLRDLLAQLPHRGDVRVLVIRGEGRAFCSGGDVNEIIGDLLQRDMRAHLEFTRLTGAVVAALRRLDRPVIAAVNGTAAGAGTVIALAADLRLASERAKFAFLFTKVGLTGADMGAAYLLPRVVGQGRALELLLFGDTIDAATAERYGLVNRVLPHDDLLPTAQAWARRLAQGPTLALGMTKRMVENEWQMDLAAALEAEAQAQALMLMGEDHRRFYDAFRQRARPEFTGR
jgi:enoyl-CoA hydratase/carnithine racemase